MGDNISLSVAQRTAVLESPYKGRANAMAAASEIAISRSKGPARKTPSKHLSFAQTRPYESPARTPLSPIQNKIGKLQGNTLMDAWRTGALSTPQKSVLQKWPYPDADPTPAKNAKEHEIAEARSTAVEETMAMVVQSAAEQAVAVAAAAEGSEGAGEAADPAEEEEAGEVVMAAHTPEKDVWNEVSAFISAPHGFSNLRCGYQTTWRFQIEPLTNRCMPDDGGSGPGGPNTVLMNEPHTLKPQP